MTREEDGKKTIKAIVYNTAAVVISMVVSLVTTIVLTKIISLSDLGIATSFTTLKGIFTIICLLSISTSINRMMLDVENHEFEYLGSIYLFSSALCFITYAIYVVLQKYINPLIGFNFKLTSLMFLMIFLINSSTILVTYWVYKNKYKLNFLYSILCNPISQIISLVLCYLLSTHKYIGRIIGIDFFNIIFGIGAGVYILYKSKLKINREYIKKSLQICVPMIPHLLAQLLLTSSDLLMIKNITGSSSAGIYSMAYTIASLLYAVLIQLFNPWSPWFYRRMKNNELESIKKNSKLLMTFCFYLCIALICISPELIKVLLNPSYYPAIKLICPICIGIFFQIMYIFFYDIEYFYKKNKQIALFSVITALLNIILNYIFIKKIGYEVAAYTTLFSYLVLLILHYFGMKRVDKRKIYDEKYLALISLSLFVLLIILTIDDSLITRGIILLSSSIYAFVIFKEKIVEFVSKRWKNDKKTRDR